jgi:hypothetical protein
MGDRPAGEHGAELAITMPEALKQVIHWQSRSSCGNTCNVTSDGGIASVFSERQSLGRR